MRLDLFCLCLSQVILLGMLRRFSRLEGSAVVVVDMPFYNFKKAFVYFSLIFEDMLIKYVSNIHSFTYHETGK